MPVGIPEGVEIAMTVLGPLQFRINGVDVTPTAPKQRQALALMAFNADQVVTASRFVDELWSGTPPRSAKTTLQTYILHLRKLISQAFVNAPTTAREILLTKPGGYLLRLPCQPLDLHRFDALSIQGRLAMAHGEPHRGSELLREALGLWNGPALVDVPVGSVLEPKVRGLQEQQLITLEHRIEADLQMGRHQEVICDLVILTAENPLNESLHEQFMRALHQAGRRSEALDIFHRLRNTLMDELGLEPSESLHRTQQMILNSPVRR
jgi:DNA-binding SARP family transcriptional activator